MAFLNNTGVERLWGKITAKLNTKVDKIDGKGLSTNDYTTTEKNKLAGIATGATKVTVDSALSSSSTNPVQNKVVNTAISNLNTLVGDTAVSTQISNAVADVVHTSEVITDAEIDAICGASLEFDNTLIDEITNITYKLYVSNGELKMTEVS